MTTRSRSLARCFALAAGASLLSSCGSSTSTPNPLAPFRDQVLTWTPCDPTVVPAGFRADLASVSARATCTFMRVPADYASPASGEILVALLRVAAEDTSARRGAILLNPGGPGDDGLFMAPAFGALWAAANPANPVGAIYKELSRRYDLIGFSPRGTGASTQLDCSSPEQLSFVANPAADRSPENIAAMLRNGGIQAAGCRKSPLTPFVNTDATARDMDLVRAVLRDPRIGYLGASYGTWLGAWWASLFPDRADRVLLSGVVDLTKGLSNIFPLQAMGQQRVWDEVMVPWAALHPDTYLLGSTTAEVAGVYPALRQETMQAVNGILTGGMGNEHSRDHLLHALLAARTVDGILDQSPPPRTSSTPTGGWRRQSPSSPTTGAAPTSAGSCSSSSAPTSRSSPRSPAPPASPAPGPRSGPSSATTFRSATTWPRGWACRTSSRRSIRSRAGSSRGVRASTGGRPP